MGFAWHMQASWSDSSERQSGCCWTVVAVFSINTSPSTTPWLTPTHFPFCFFSNRHSICLNLLHFMSMKPNYLDSTQPFPLYIFSFSLFCVFQYKVHLLTLFCSSGHRKILKMGNIACTRHVSGRVWTELHLHWKINIISCNNILTFFS